jgi:hypothetical protein
MNLEFANSGSLEPKSFRESSEKELRFLLASAELVISPEQACTCLSDEGMVVRRAQDATQGIHNKETT